MLLRFAARRSPFASHHELTASVIASAVTGRLRVPVGAAAPSLWVMAVGTVLFGISSGALDTVLNAYAAGHFGAREINWMHASYGLGATVGPLLVTAMLSAGWGWRSASRRGRARRGRRPRRPRWSAC